MPPKQRTGPRNVVKSGNAGNSSKAKPAAAAGAVDGAGAAPFEQPKRLFPVGYKTPVQLLSEKCQKEGWERPVIDSRANADTDPKTYTAVVTLKRRKGKSIDQFDVVRMQPIPRIEQEDPQMARHFGATYAMYRIYNHLPMAMLLPPTIRPYWSVLTKEKAQAPAHRDWEYSSNPFDARKEVENRQHKREEKQQQQQQVQATIAAGGELDHRARETRIKRGWENVPEVKMTQSQRELVEDVIRRMMAEYPSAILQGARESAATPSTFPSGTNTPAAFDSASIEHQLRDLGFRPAHVTSCINALSAAHDRMHHRGSSGTINDPLTLSLSILSPFEAAIEWLLVHLPEDDLPRSYRPASNTADFVSGVTSENVGKQGLVKGWVVDKLVKQAGFPRKVVEEVTAEDARETIALDALGYRLCGWEYAACPGCEDVTARDAAREEELMVLKSVLDDRISHNGDQVVIRINHDTGHDSLELNILLSSESCYPSEGHDDHPPSFYLTSSTLPAYLKLHLHRRLLERFRDPERPDLAEALASGAGGAIFAMVEVLEEDLPAVIDSPPDIASVTEHLQPRAAMEPIVEATRRVAAPKRQRTARAPRAPTEVDHQRVTEAHERMKASGAYANMRAARAKLPAWQERVRVNELLASNRVLIVVGETGCGKSTQVPQFILDDAIERGHGAATSILVTQPRRVSAMGLATRVAEERMENLDRDIQSVGYVIRGESKVKPGVTRLTFATTGVVLRRLSAGGDSNLEGISHIVVDEVHERSVDGDFLLLQLKELLQRNKTIKVILMSATINQQTFVDYFGGVPTLEIPGFTHPVQDLYLEDYVSNLDYLPESSSRFKVKQNEDQKVALRQSLEKLNLSDAARNAVEAVSTSTQVSFELIGSIVRHIHMTSPKDDEGVLVFLPGVAEIRMAMDSIRGRCGSDVAILPLHANLSNDDQKRVFAPTKQRKVVVATNVAETSITIPDIVYVIDAGKVKETQYEAETGLSKLVEVWASRAACRQRRGRAGRTKPGVCYKLFTRRIEEQHMARFAVPEILRTPLEALFLQIKAMDQDADVKAYLRRAIDPPKIEALDSAWRTLIDLGAVEGEEATSRLTALGRHMSALPVDLRLAKMLVLGCIFRALEPALTVAALLSSKPFFSAPIERREEARKAREKFAWGKSDILLNLRALDAVADQPGWSSRRSFCEEHFINFSAFRDVASLRQDFADALQELGYLGRGKAAREALNGNAGNENLIKAILVGAFYPRVVTIRPPGTKFEKVQSGSVAKDHEAKEVRFFDETGRVFIHPGSILFSETNLKLGYLTYFHKAVTSKPFLFDATEVPLFAMLLFGGPVTVDHFAGGLTVGKAGGGEGSVIRMRAWSRVGILVNQIRRLLDASLEEAIENAQTGGGLLGEKSEVVKAILALLG